MAIKDTRIFDLNLFSGSSELFRQAVGGFYYNSGDGAIEFAETDSIEPPLQIEEYVTGEPDDSSDSIFPRIKYPTRLFSNGANIQIVSDDDWKTFIIGGNYADKNYAGIYNDNVYADHYNTSPLPLFARDLINTTEQPSMVLTTEYFNHYLRFQTFAANRDSELQIPNFYLLDSSSYLRPQAQTGIIQSRYQYNNIKNFLTNSYVNSQTIENPDLQNIFILDLSRIDDNNGLRLDTQDLLEHGGFDDDFSLLYSLMPYGNKIYIDNEITNPNEQMGFRTVFQNNNFQVKLVKLLKEVFQGESNLQTSLVNFVVNTEATISTGTATNTIQNTTTLPVKLVDLPTMILYSYRNPTSETENITLITGSVNYSQQSDYAFDTTGIYRYENTKNSLSVLNDLVDVVRLNFETAPIDNLSDFILQANQAKIQETVAFRIQKIGGGPTGDSNTENTIQNIWFYNSGDAITYLDTQVKYDTEYTYKIYKYDIVQGYKYQLSDAVVTRQIATEGEGTDKIYCLEFYDAFTGQTTPQLFSDENLRSQFERSSSIDQEISDLEAELINFYIMEYSWKNSELNSAQETIWNNILDGTNNLDENVNPTGYLRGFREDTDTFIRLEEELGSWIKNVQGKQCGTYFNWVSRGGFSGTGTASGFNNTEITVCKGINFLNDSVIPAATNNSEANSQIEDLQQEQEQIGSLVNSLTSNSQINSSYPYLADFNMTIEPSVKIIEIPLEEKRMRIVDHPPNDFIITPHHMLDQSNRLAFYCKYDTFSMNAVTYPPTLTAQDEENRAAYLTGNDFLSTSEQTQESVSPARFIEVYRTTTKPTGYSDFTGNLRQSIDLRQSNGDVLTDHLFVERVRENIKYYYAFRAVNENGVAGQMSPVFEAELINDGGYVYASFIQYSEEDLAVPPPKEPLMGFKKLFNIIPNIQHLQLDTSAVNFASSSVSQVSQVALGTSAQDNLWDPNKYYKIRLTSKKTGKKLDLNIGFKKEERN